MIARENRCRDHTGEVILYENATNCQERKAYPQRGLRRNSLTIRQRLLQMLRESELTARDISRLLGIREKEVYEHLPHIERSLRKGSSLICRAARCLDCGFVFKKRQRFTTPSRCPVCRSESISPPVYAVKEPPGK
ncbi:MAG: ArsR family transcriptional regulator [Desulfomonilaceae bacterium]